MGRRLDGLAWLAIPAVGLFALGAIMATRSGAADVSTPAAVTGTAPTDAADADPASVVDRARVETSHRSTGPAESTIAVASTTSSMPPDNALAVAVALAPAVVLPSDCPLPLDEPESLPNADRSYRSGVHQGIDFICEATGRQAVSAMDGRAVMVRSGYREPTPADRGAVLAGAAETDRTPPWTLAMLYGNFVVIDHGNVAGVGHVATIYAHLESIDAGIGTGAWVAAGQPVGMIGNTGTNAAATGTDRPRSLHLHWEIHVDERHLGAGLDVESTRAVYQRLFGATTDSATTQETTSDG